MRYFYTKCYASCRIPQHVLPVAVTLLVWCAEFCSSDVYMQALCGHTVQSAGERIYSQSELHYQPNTNCTVILSGLHRGEKIFLRVDDTDIRGDDDCNGDYLEIYDYSKASKISKHRRRLICGTGRNVATKVTSRGNSLRLVFITDGKINGRGFKASFTALIPDKQCREFGKFRCANRRCISTMLTCDSEDNCDDGSDERPKACGDHNHKHSLGKIREGDLQISSAIFMSIGAILVLLFFYFCIPQCVTHLMYFNKKQRKRREQQKKMAETESGAGSTGRPSISSLRSRPSVSSAFLPHWEVKMSELYDTRRSTVSLQRGSILPTSGSDDRDKAIADVVSAGKKVHVGRFMVQKSVIEEEQDEEEHSEDGVDGSDYEDDHVVPFRRSRSRTKSDPADDDHETGWIRRMETRISRRFDTRQDSEKISTESIQNVVKKKNFAKKSGKIESFRKKVASSGVKAKLSSRKLPSSIHDRWGNAGKNDASHILVRPRSSTLPFNLPSSSAHPSTYNPEWDFSDENVEVSERSMSFVLSSDNESSETVTPTGVSSSDVQTLRKTPDVIQHVHDNASKPSQKSGEDNVSWDFSDDDDESAKMPSANTVTSDCPPPRQTSPVVAQSKSPLSPSSGTDKFKWDFSDDAESAEIGNFKVRKLETPEIDQIRGERILAVNSVSKGRFTVQKVDRTPTAGKQETAIALNDRVTKGRFNVTKVEEPNSDGIVTASSNLLQKTQGRFKVEKPETFDKHDKEGTASQTAINKKVTKNRFSVTKVEEPNVHGIVTAPSNALQTCQTTSGRFTMQKVEKTETCDKHDQQGTASQYDINKTVTKKRFSVTKVEEPNVHDIVTAPSNPLQTTQGRFTVQTVETTPSIRDKEETASQIATERRFRMPTIGTKRPDDKPIQNKGAKGRFSVTKIEEPNDYETGGSIQMKNDSSSINKRAKRVLPRKLSYGTGRFNVELAQQQDRDSKGSETMKTSFENYGLVFDETTPMLSDHNLYDDDNSDDEFADVLETEI